MTKKTDADPDTVYTHLSRTMNRLGEDNGPLFLACFALLAIERLDDKDAAIELIDAAAQALTETTSI